MAVINTKAFPKQLDKSIDKMFFEEYAAMNVEYDRIAKITTAPSGGKFTEAQLSSVGALVEKPEGSGIVFDSPEEGNEVSRTYTTYGLGVQFTEEMFEDDYHGKIKRISGELAKSAKYRPESDFWSLFNSGFATHTAWDGQYIFDASGRVLLKSGAAQNNCPSVAAALSETSLQASIEYFQTVKDSAGRPVKATPKYLIVPTGLQWVAKTLLGTDLKVNSFDNDINTIKGEGLQQFTSVNLTSSTAWFVLGAGHDFNLMWKRKVRVETSNDFSTGSAMTKVTMRYATFCNNPIECYGTAGA